VVALNAGKNTGRAADGFGSLHRHGFARVAVAIPEVNVADPASNAGQVMALARRAAGEHAVLTVFPEHYFAAARDTAARQIRLLGQDVAFGPDLLFDAEGLDSFSFHAEICKDLWVPVPLSTWAALAGATVLVILSASNIVVGKAAYRRQLCQSQSARCIAAYLYAAAGSGESTTDLARDGDALVCKNGEQLAEGTRFAAAGELVTADIDLQRLVQDRMRMTSFTDARHDHASRPAGLRRIPVALAAPAQEARLRREIPRFPYVPADPADRDERCAEVYHIQVHGLAGREGAAVPACCTGSRPRQVPGS
jgi:NAD+ synthase (glutamine-hydrolysing)